MTPAEVAQFRHRIMVDCMLEGSALYWERRAREFDAVVVGDNRPGTDGQAAVSAITAAAQQTAAACRNKAAVLRMEVGQ